jgi:hypothetical protein
MLGRARTCSWAGRGDPNFKAVPEPVGTLADAALLPLRQVEVVGEVALLVPGGLPRPPSPYVAFSL